MDSGQIQALTEQNRYLITIITSLAGVIVILAGAIFKIMSVRVKEHKGIIRDLQDKVLHILEGTNETLDNTGKAMKDLSDNVKVSNEVMTEFMKMVSGSQWKR